MFVCSFFFIFESQAQWSEEEVEKKGYISDDIMNIIISHLPDGWNFADEDGYFIFQRKDSIWELAESASKVTGEKKADKNKRIQAEGKKTIAKIILKYEKKWDFIKIQEATISNQKIDNEIVNLAQKHKISGLKDLKLSSKEGIVYTPKTENDKKRIAEYYAEKKQLEEKIIRLPEMSSQKYSLFIISKSGGNDESHIIFPEEASLEMYTILSLCREVCGK